MADSNEEQIIVEVVYDTDDAQKNVTALTEDIVGLESANKDLKKQLDKGKISQEDFSKATEANKVTIQKNKAERKDNIKFLQAEKGSQDKLQKSVKLLTNERKKLNIESQEGQEKAAKLNKQIDGLRDSINDNSSALEQNKNNIGRYKEGVSEALSEAGLFGDQLKDTIGSLFETASAGAGAGKGFGAVAGGIGSATKAAIKFMLTPIGAVIAAIAAAVLLLTGALKRNEGFLDKTKEIFAGLSNVIEEVFGRVQKVIGAFGRLFKGQISLKEALKESGEAFEGMGQAMRDAYEEGQKLIRLQRQIEENSIKNTVALAELNAEYEKQSAIADDATRSFAEMQAANEKAAKAAKEGAEIELEASQLILEEVNLRIAQAERQGRLNRELRKEQAEAMAAAIEAQTRLTTVVFQNEKVRREIARDVFEQELDFILDVADARKTANEKLIADEKRTFEERRGVLDETNNFVNESFAQQIKLVEEYGQVNIDINKLLKLNNEESAQYAFSLGLNEIATNRLLEVIRERIMATSDLREASEDLAESESDARQKAREEEIKFDKEVQDSLEKQDAEDEARLQKKLDAEQKQLEESEKIAQEFEEARIDREKEIAEERANILTSSFLAITDITAAFVSGQIKSFGEFSKQIGVLLIDQLTKVLVAKNAEILFQSLATPDSIATFGVSGGLRAAGIIALTTAAGAAAKAGIQSLGDGGEMKFGTFGGNLHSQGGNNLYDSNGNLIATF